MGEEFNMDNFMQYYDSDTEGILSNTSLSDGISTVLEIINILVFLIDVTVILLMLFKCRKFRVTRAYEDFAGTKNLAKAVEIITILLAIDAVYSLTRIFVIVDAINLLKQIIPDLPVSIFAYSIAVNIVLPVLSFVVSVCVWNMYQNTKKLFYSLYPNGALPVIDINEPKRAGENLYGANTGPDLSYTSRTPIPQNQIRTMSDSFDAYKSAAEKARSGSDGKVKDEDIFGTGVSDDYMTRISKTDEAKMEELLIQDEPAEPIEDDFKAAQADNEDSIFGTGNTSDWQAVSDMDDPAIAEMLISEDNEQDNGLDLGSSDEDFFGSGTSEDYMKRFTSADEAKIAELLVQDEPEEQ